MADPTRFDELEELRRLLPLPPDDPAGQARARARLALATSAAAREPPARWRETPRLAIAASVALLLVAALGALGRGVIGAPPAEAALLELAQVADSRPATGLAPGTYAYSRSRQRVLVTLTGDEIAGTGRDALAFRLTSTRQFWVGQDGTRRIRTTIHEAEFFDEASGELFAELGLAADHGIGATVDEVFGPQEGDLRPGDWPVDAPGLEAALRRHAAQGDPGLPADVGVLELAAGLLRESSATPELRSGLFEVLARLDGLEVEDVSAGGTAQTRVHLDYELAGVRWQRTLGFDPATSELVFEGQRALDALADEGVPAGTWVSEAHYLQTGTVEEPGRQP